MLTNAALSAETLASVFEQSVDCVKLVGLDGKLLWMNANGICAMEVDDFCSIRDQHWSATWPAEMHVIVNDALVKAATGEVVRFDAYCPTAKGNPRWWSVCVTRVENADTTPVGFLAISRDITSTETSRQALEIAVEEMRHRIRNTYAMISGLLAGFAEGNPEREAFAREMRDRLATIAAAQTLFSSDNAPSNISDLVTALVMPFNSARCLVSVANMPVIAVDQGRADAIALVLGELAVNASKHGALAAGGSIGVSAVERPGGFAIIWDEISNQPVASHGRTKGQGLKLIDRIIGARGGVLDIKWHEYGLSVTSAFGHQTQAAN